MWCSCGEQLLPPPAKKAVRRASWKDLARSLHGQGKSLTEVADILEKTRSQVLAALRKTQ